MANCCNSLSAITRDCGPNLGGIKRAWVNCYSTAGTPTITADIITALGSDTGWVEIEFKKETSNFTIPFNRDNTNGSQYYAPTISIVVPKMTTQKNSAIREMAYSDLVFIIQDNNGIYWYFGYTYYLELDDGSEAASGTAFTDLNGYTLNFTGAEGNLPYEVSDAAMAPILA